MILKSRCLGDLGRIDHMAIVLKGRLPATPRIIVYHTESGNEVTRLDIAGDVDDIFYDAANKRIYASCGEGCYL